MASTPFQPYTGELVAPVNAQQYAGINAINQNAGFASPYINQARQYAVQGATPITADQIASYQNPYTQQVVNATQAQFANQNAEQQSQLLGNAAAQGALGGDRSAVAQAELSRQQNLAQNPVIAGLYSQGYQTALQTALAEQQQQANAAYSLGNLGVAGQNAALSGASAQIGAGNLLQQTQQAQDQAGYGQYLQALGFPYQQTQWLAGLATGVGSQLGGTSAQQATGTGTNVGTTYGQTTAPPPNTTAQWAGLGLAGAGLFAARGGGVKGYDDGGFVVPYSGGRGFIPAAPIARGVGLPGAPTMASLPPGVSTPTGASTAGVGASQGNPFQVSNSALSLGKSLQKSGLHDKISDWVDDLTDKSDAEAYGGRIAGFDRGGIVRAGFGLGSLVPSYQEGGDVDDQAPFRVADMGRGSWYYTGPGGYRGESGVWSDPSGAREGPPASGARHALPGIALPSRRTLGEPFDVRDEQTGEDYRLPQVDTGPAPWTGKKIDINAPAGERMGYTAETFPTGGRFTWTPAQHEAAGPPMQASDELPPEITTGRSRSADPSDAMAYADERPSGFAGRRPAPDRSGFSGVSNVLGLSPAAKQGLLAAGLGMLANRSPFFGVGVGEGGLRGLQAYAGAKQEERAGTKQSFDMDMAVKKLAQDAEKSRKHFEMEGAKLAESQRQHEFARTKPEKIGIDPKTSADIYGIRDPKAPGGYRIIDPNTMRDQQITVPPTTTPTPAPAPNTPSPAVPPTSPAVPVPGSPAEKVASDEGILPANARLVQGGAYDYGQDAPYIEKGMDVPEPQGLAGRSPRSLQTDAEYYLQTGKLPGVRGTRGPVAVAQQNYRNAVQNYAGALAQSRGVSPEQTADMWRTAPGMLRFILGADGRSTVSLGTAVRHLDTLVEYANEWGKGNVNSQTLQRLRAAISREFGGTAATNLESVSQIVGPEIIKAIGVAGAGTADDRNRAAGQFTSARTLPQVLEAVKSTQRLLGGQLEGRERQARNAGVSEGRFKDLIGERPYEILKTIDKGGMTEAPSAPATPPAEKPKTVIQNGHTYTLQPDGSYR